MHLAIQNSHGRQQIWWVGRVTANKVFIKDDLLVKIIFSGLL